jgi:hypothetical protein
MSGYRCRSCGAWHEERPTCFIAPLPEAVFQIPEKERKGRVEASSDQCILDGKHFFILGNLDIPVRGSEELLRWTVWSTLSEANFRRAAELWETPGRESEPPYFGWLSNRIPGYSGTLHIKALVRTQAVGVRPLIEVVEEDHELTRDQREGIDESRLDALVHAAWQPVAGEGAADGG